MSKFEDIESKIIVKCPECLQKLRLPLFQHKLLTVKCPNPKCQTEFKFDYKKFHSKRRTINFALNLLFVILLLCVVGMPLVAIPKFTAILENVEKDYTVSITQVESENTAKINTLKEENIQELVQIDTDDHRNQLRNQAVKHYKQIWIERENYNARYAITPREKAQLEMLAFAKDKTKSLKDIIRSIAIKAAPKNSTVNIYQVNNGLRLDIDFDMSELTSGEHGTQTKHLTIDSLKREVVKLISKVTNDVYMFCQDLDLTVIAIGCRHYVNYKYDNRVSNVILYKVKLDKKDIKELKNNPFLDLYSTTKYFKIEEDDFPNLSIGNIL